MAQITSGLRSILSLPIIYNLLQSLMGGKSSRDDFSKNFIKPKCGMTILDIGCGPAEILKSMPRVNYFGFDINANYIDRAKKTFGDAGRFNCEILTEEILTTLPPFDIVLALGLLHHLDEDKAIEVLKLASLALKPGGRFISIDPCWDHSQNLIAKLLIRFDRGQNVRDDNGYKKLVGAVFPMMNIEIKHTKWIPYTHCIITCNK